MVVPLRMDNLVGGPSRSIYKESSPFIYFSYMPGRKTFQQGYFGITNQVSIAGFLHLRFPADHPLYVKRIQVCFSGKEFIQLKEFGPKVLNSICNVTLELWKSPNDDYREIHDMDLPFEISLPLDVPQSTTTVKGRARFDYYLRAIITKKPNFKHPGSTKIIECAYTVNRYILPPLPDPKSWIKDDPTKQGIGYEILLNNRIFGPRYPIVLRMKLTFYDPRISLKGIVLGLKEYNAIGSEMRSRFLGRRILRGERISMSVGSQSNECTTDIKFAIPDDCIIKPTWSNESFHIKVTHKVQVKVRFGLFSKYNFNLTIPVKLVNMLDVEDEEYLATEILYQQEFPESGTRSNTPPPTYEPNWFPSLPPYPLNA